MIKRYSESRELVPCDDGRWCLYEDADKRIAELVEVIKDVIIPYIDPVDTDILDPVVKVLEGDVDEDAC